MDIFHYHPQTGLLLGQDKADPDPLTPGAWIWPAFSTPEVPPTAGESERVRFDGQQWLVEPIPVPPPPPAPPEPTPEEIQRRRVAAVQRHLDEHAQAYGYDGIFTAVTYAGEPSVPRFQAEGQAFRRWRSLVWAKCYEILAEVQAGSRPIPSEEELLAQLPPFQPPAS